MQANLARKVHEIARAANREQYGSSLVVSLAGNNMTDSPSWIGYVTTSPGNEMHMTVHDCLSCSFPSVVKDWEAIAVPQNVGFEMIARDQILSAGAIKGLFAANSIRN